MGTRSGDIDPSAMDFICQKANMAINGFKDVLNKKSGVQGMSGVSSDFRDLQAGAAEGNERCAMAVDVFCYRAVKYIGAYVAAMDGVDAIAFTAGLGENDEIVRRKIVNRLGYLGIKLDDEANNNGRGKEIAISTPDSKVPVWIVPTNEELAIARETVALLK